MTTNRTASRLRGAVAGVLLFAAGWLVGNATPLLPAFRPWAQPAPPAPSAGETPPATSSPREQALARLAERARDLSGRQESLQAAVKETRLAYQMLRHRGSSADSEECRRLEARQRRLEQGLRDVEANLDEARRSEARLHQFLDGTTGAPGTLIPEDRWAAPADGQEASGP